MVMGRLRARSESSGTHLTVGNSDGHGGRHHVDLHPGGGRFVYRWIGDSPVCGISDWVYRISATDKYASVLGCWDRRLPDKSTYVGRRSISDDANNSIKPT